MPAPTRNPRPRLATDPDQLLKDALAKMQPVLPRKAPGRHLFDDAKRRPLSLQQILCAMELAAEHGVPLTRILEISAVFDGYARYLVARRETRGFVRPMSLMLCEEARLDADADVAQMDLAREENEHTLRAAYDTLIRHIEYGKELAGALGGRLFAIAQRHAQKGA